MAVTVITPPGAARREAVICGLENLAAFIEDNPGLPLAWWSPEDPCNVSVYGGGDGENRAEVDRAAAILGVRARTLPGAAARYMASRDFGGGVMYRIHTAGSQSGAPGATAGNEEAAA